MREAQIDEAYLNIAKVLGGYRRLGSSLNRLLADVVSVLTGFRPGFLLDYCQIQPKDLASAVASVARCMDAMHSFCILDLGNCCLVVDPYAALIPEPMFVVFDRLSKGSVAARWACEIEARSIHQSIQEVYKAIVEACRQNGGTHPSSLSSVPIIDLGSVIGDLTLPTLNGCLLGYPAVYVVKDEDEGQAASRYLSSSTLRLHSVFADILGKKGIRRGTGDSMISFSLPIDLEGEEAWALQKNAWRACLQERHAAAQELVPYGPFDVIETSHMRCVAL